MIYGAKSTEEAELAELTMDTLLGYGYMCQDVDKALQMARQCPCLTWLHQGVTGKETLCSDLRKMAANGNLYAYGPLGSRYDDLERAANFGCPIAQVLMFNSTTDKKWLELAMKQYYGRAYFVYGLSYDCIPSIQKSAEMGCIDGMVQYSKYCLPVIGGAYWLCKAYIKSGKFAYILDLIKERNWCTDEILQIGYMCDDFKYARDSYVKKCVLIKESLSAWSICAKRLKVYKDVRVLIAKMVWKERVYRTE